MRFFTHLPVVESIFIQIFSIPDVTGIEISTKPWHWLFEYLLHDMLGLPFYILYRMEQSKMEPCSS